MRNDYIYGQVEKLSIKYATRDPIRLLESLNVVVAETDRYEKLKGYCFLSCKTFYVMISSFLPDAEKRVVAAHELGHIALHRQQLQLAPMKDCVLYDMASSTEYEANLFAADLIIRDEDIEEMSQNEDLDYFGVCSSLYVPPELMSFKLFSLLRRGYAYQMPMELDSRFLAK
ncbi:MAG: ImmA/IrrE family metallo-endopeptidase [Lachnospiraceae bacterium]|nr:ImmA/IrrE family metallo-endopeptidase [Lachnospiraceae bacterium]